MGFATAYLGKRSLFKTLVEEKPLPGTGLIIIVPCYDEPGISLLLDSLASCDRPGCPVEVIAGINAPDSAGERQIEQNRLTLGDIESWKGVNRNAPFRLFAFDTGRSKIRGWGAGTARKVLMDEALRRFDITGNSDGIIVSLDADCLVSAGYLKAIYNRFSDNPRVKGASIRFEHLIPGDITNPLREAISAYELHLRYYYQALKYSGYPDVFHTVGSAIAVRASAYAAVGGMSRRQAGEDFYFIQKMIPSGGFIEINDAVVYPSPRISERVPFGTGPAVKSVLADPDHNYYTYNPEAFTELKKLTSVTGNLWLMPDSKIDELTGQFGRGLSVFLTNNDWSEHIREARMNTAGEASFIKRFYGWFNMFMVVKYLNYVHVKGYYNKLPVKEAAEIMLGWVSGAVGQVGVVEMLEEYRRLEQ